MRPIRKPVARKYFGVTLDFKVLQWRHTYDKELDVVSLIQAESDVRRFQVRALGEDRDEALETAELALIRSVSNGNKGKVDVRTGQATDGYEELVSNSVVVMDITEIDISKPERTLSFV